MAPEPTVVGLLLRGHVDINFGAGAEGLSRPVDRDFVSSNNGNGDLRSSKRA